MIKEKTWIYDIEVYPNFFLIFLKNKEKEIYFEISSFKDERINMLKFLRDEVNKMIGFNNLNYDYLIIHYIIVRFFKIKNINNRIYNLSKSIIEGKKIYIKKPLIKQIDLFKINHYDNKAKLTSLKILQFNLRLKNIQELPYNPNKNLNKEEINNIILYCKNDVITTEILYHKTIKEIELRKKLSIKHNVDFTNYNSSKIGETILINKIVKEIGENKVYEIIETEYGNRKIIKNTKRDKIVINDIIFDYIHFKTEPFQKILQWFKSKVITETKNVFTKIPFKELEILQPYYHIKKVTGKQKNLNVCYKGVQYDFGVGGLHACVKPNIFKSREYELHDIDFKSFYPNLAIHNKFYPKHLSKKFCEVYKGIYEERKKYNKKQFPIENLTLKLILNSAYGKSNSNYSPLFDTEYTLKTTINGQLILCLLIENILENIKECKVLMANTDGVLFYVHKNKVQKLKELCKSFENLTNLELEYVKYEKMILKDANNLIGIDVYGNIKRKGIAFIYKEVPGELELYKNFSMLIVPKALEAYFIKNIGVKDFILNHNNLYDFFKRTKLNKTSKLFSRIYNKDNNILEEKENQRITRYFISGFKIYNKETKTYSYKGCGETLIKVMPPLKDKTEKREFNIESGYLCTTMNNIKNIEEMKSKIYYQYYIDEVYKIINLIKKSDF